MKRQFLGDARDAFKWEYHDYLVKALKLPVLQIVPMMNEDDLSGEGKSHPTNFPAAPEFHEFCLRLRKSRSLDDLRHLPKLTGAEYRVIVHNADIEFTDSTRETYFSDIHTTDNQVLFVDPCTGFEPGCRTVKHIAFSDVKGILSRVSEGSVVSVYQHWQHKSFLDTIMQIRDRLPGYHFTKIISHPVMIVAIGKTKAIIDAVTEANLSYAAKRGLSG